MINSFVKKKKINHSLNDSAVNQILPCSHQSCSASIFSLHWIYFSKLELFIFLSEHYRCSWLSRSLEDQPQLNSCKSESTAKCGEHLTLWTINTDYTELLASISFNHNLFCRIIHFISKFSFILTVAEGRLWQLWGCPLALGLRRNGFSWNVKCRRVLQSTPLRTQETVRVERTSGRGGGGRRKRRLKQREKGTVFHSPSNVLSVKTSRLCFTALHSTASQPLRLMAGLTNHNPSTVLWQGQMGSKRILALNETIRNVAECCWHFVLVLLCYRKGTSLHHRNSL